MTWNMVEMVKANALVAADDKAMRRKNRCSPPVGMYQPRGIYGESSINSSISSNNAFNKSPKNDVIINNSAKYAVQSTNGMTCGSPDFTGWYGFKVTHTQATPKSKSSPSRGSTPSPKTFMGGSCAFAGAKFSEPPSAALLPKPPSSWMSDGNASSMSQKLCDDDGQRRPSNGQAIRFSDRCSNLKSKRSIGLCSKNCLEMSEKLKIMLNVQA